ncbi:hypothetical protein BSLG_003948 [Batrachochytrium salamandrivorans]|nr:hypothetical protein BSLG_003948 [Batrachochytrium salamandrivorans]
MEAEVVSRKYKRGLSGFLCGLGHCSGRRNINHNIEPPYAPESTTQEPSECTDYYCPRVKTGQTKETQESDRRSSSESADDSGSPKQCSEKVSEPNTQKEQSLGHGTEKVHNQGFGISSSAKTGVSTHPSGPGQHSNGPSNSMGLRCPGPPKASLNEHPALETFLSELGIIYGADCTYVYAPNADGTSLTSGHELEGNNMVRFLGLWCRYQNECKTKKDLAHYYLKDLTSGEDARLNHAEKLGKVTTSSSKTRNQFQRAWTKLTSGQQQIIMAHIS